MNPDRTNIGITEVAASLTSRASSATRETRSPVSVCSICAEPSRRDRSSTISRSRATVGSVSRASQACPAHVHRAPTIPATAIAPAATRTNRWSSLPGSSSTSQPTAHGATSPATEPSSPAAHTSSR